MTSLITLPLTIFVEIIASEFIPKQLMIILSSTKTNDLENEKVNEKENRNGKRIKNEEAKKPTEGKTHTHTQSSISIPPLKNRKTKSPILSPNAKLKLVYTVVGARDFEL